MIRRPPRSTLSSSSAASDVYKRQSLVYTSNTGTVFTDSRPKLRFNESIVNLILQYSVFVSNHCSHFNDLGEPDSGSSISLVHCKFKVHNQKMHLSYPFPYECLDFFRACSSGIVLSPRILFAEINSTTLPRQKFVATLLLNHVCVNAVNSIARNNTAFLVSP